MIFTKAKPNENYAAARFVSETGRWELGLVPMLFGVRVRAGLAGRGWVTIDYCAGADLEFQAQLLTTMMVIMECLPESISERDIQDILPGYEIRPINLDPCWGKLLELAESLTKAKETALQNAP